MKSCGFSLIVLPKILFILSKSLLLRSFIKPFPCVKINISKPVEIGFSLCTHKLILFSIQYCSIGFIFGLHFNSSHLPKVSFTLSNFSTSKKVSSKLNLLIISFLIANLIFKLGYDFLIFS